MAGKIEIRRDENRYSTFTYIILRDGVCVAECEDARDAENVAALLRFRSAMTPEMWEDVRKLTEMRKLMGFTAESFMSALDTLRTALQRETGRPSEPEHGTP